MQRIGVDLADVVTLRISPRRAWLLVESLPDEALVRKAVADQQRKRANERRLAKLKEIEARRKGST